MKLMNKILFHINSLGKGGAERVIVNLSEEIAKMGIECVIATEWFDADEYPLKDTVRRIDVGVSGRESEYSASKLRSERRKLLHKAILAEKPDAIVSFCRNANYRALLAARGTKIPVIFSVRSDPKTDYASIKDKVLSSFLYRKASGAVFQTTEARDFFSSAIADKSVVLLNPLNPKYIDNVKTVNERRRVIVTAGRFHEAKDHIVLIKAFERIKDEYSDVNLELYGAKSEDNTYEMIKKYVADNKLEERVLFMGNSNKLEELIIDASVFVLSSKYEGMPNALMEAMAMGLPVVSTDCPCGGPREIIENGVNGLLVNVGDGEKMAEAMKYMLDNPKEANEMGEKASKITEYAAPNIIAEKWVEYIKSVI